MIKTEFVSCLKWVNQGRGKETLEKVKHNREELAEVIKELKLKEAEFKSRPKPTTQEGDGLPEKMSEDDDDESDPIDSYYGMENYDEENDDPLVPGEVEQQILENEPDSCSEDSEDEADEFTVKPNDNLILTGHVQDTLSILDIYVFNNENAEFFILHDILLPSYPVCIEWLDYDSRAVGTRGHFAAIGSMEPEIHIWNLNVSGCLEPYHVLGPKKSKSRHTDSVVDLSWNPNARNILASASADKTVLLWDLQSSTHVTRLGPFQEKVSSLVFHPVEPQNLLTGSDNGGVKLYDCRSPDLFKSWGFEGEIERVVWNAFDPYGFFTTTAQGMVHFVDIRQNKAVWDLKAHDKEVTGLALSSGCGDLLMTASTDEDVKVWDISGGVAEFVFNKNMNIGSIYALAACPDIPYVFCCGGSNPKNYLYLWDVRENETIMDRFANSGRLNINSPRKPVSGETQETSNPTPSTSRVRTSGNDFRSPEGRIEVSRKPRSKTSHPFKKEHVKQDVKSQSKEKKKKKKGKKKDGGQSGGKKDGE